MIASTSIYIMNGAVNLHVLNKSSGLAESKEELGEVELEYKSVNTDAPADLLPARCADSCQYNGPLYRCTCPLALLSMNLASVCMPRP